MKLRDLIISHRNRLKANKDRNNWTDKDWTEFIKSSYKNATGNVLNIDNPQRFTEKIQWRKINDINPIYAKLADKYKVREWIKKKIGEKHLIPLIGIYDSIDEIDFEKLPEKYVIKTNNASATNTIVTSKINKCQKKLLKENYDYWMKMSYGNYSGERHYNLIKPKILIEHYLESDDSSKDLRDYKFYCFEGKPKYVQIINERFSNKTIDYYDMNWKHQEFIGLDIKCHNSNNRIEKPVCFEEMKDICVTLAHGFSFVRIDLYETNKKVYFGEMTFTPGSGLGKFEPDEWDYKLGSMWDIKGIQVEGKLCEDFNS